MSQPTSSSRVIFVMTLIAAFCGAVIVIAYLYTAPLIKHNQDMRIQEAALAVAPQAARMQTVTVDSVHFFLGFNKSDSLVRIAIEAQGQGFSDQIRVLYAYDPRTQTITGFKAVESKETPGIGDKINSDAEFLANFQALDATQPIVAVKHGKKVHAYEIDGITGATISSKAVAKLMQKSQQKVLPIVQNYWENHYGSK